MKNTITVIFCLLVLGGSGYVIYDHFFLLCDYPLSYSIGEFDERFNLTKNDFLNTVKEAETVWESAVGEELFKYDSEASFTINLLFDDRQEATIEANQSEMEIGGTKTTYDVIYGQYEAQRSAYIIYVMQYEANITAYNQRLNEYNEKVSEINARGGAKPSEVEQLNREKMALENMADELESQRQDINSRASALNTLGNQINALGKKLNIQVDIHNEQFGQRRQFDQGDYRGDRINIYQFQTKNDLRLVLAHEFGHALGLEHLENPESIMYYLMEAQNIVNPKATVEDILAVKQICRL